jgi:ferredoxin-nitrite reductase
LADISGELGDGDIRLTVWQNLIISGVKDHNLAAAKARIEACGLEWQANSIRAGLVACTGSNGCKFGGADTKRQAIEIAEYVETRVSLDQPINIHLTGCHHTCAQHYIGDLGLIGARVPIDEDGEETVDGYHIFVGGGFGENAKIGRELVHEAKADECPVLIEKILKAYMDKRENAQESFFQFSNRHEISDLQSMMSAVEVEGAHA